MTCVDVVLLIGAFLLLRWLVLVVRFLMEG